MSQTPKEKPTADRESEDKRSYYYDDAHGYEDFDPESADEDDRSLDRNTPSSRQTSTDLPPRDR